MMTKKQKLVLDILAASADPLTPTEIGERAGQTYDKASSWANGALVALQEQGLVHPNPGGPRSLTERGQAFARGAASTQQDA